METWRKHAAEYDALNKACIELECRKEVQGLKADGECLFAAVEDQLKRTLGRNHVPSALELRLQCVKYIKKHKGMVDAEVLQSQAALHNTPRMATLKGYLKQMKIPTTYGDRTCIDALTAMLDISIKMVCSEGKGYIPSTNTYGNKVSLFLFNFTEVVSIRFYQIERGFYSILPNRTWFLFGFTK